MYCCDICLYYELLPILPKRVYFQGNIQLINSNEACLKFTVHDAFQNLDFIQIIDRQRPNCRYQGSWNNKFTVEDTLKPENFDDLMDEKNNIYSLDLTIIKDVYSDGFFSITSEIYVQTNGFYIILRVLLFVQHAIIKIRGTRYFFNKKNKYIMKEYTMKNLMNRELWSKDEVLNATCPKEIEKHLVEMEKEYAKLHFQ